MAAVAVAADIRRVWPTAAEAATVSSSSVVGGSSKVFV